MAFDDSTRNRLQRFVSDARALLSEEFTRQMQHEYGMDPASGEVADLDRLSHLDDTRRETARLLRDTLAHYLATTPSGGKQEALQRILREQAFTVLNRLAALRMMEARGILLESIARGYQSQGFQLYQRLAGSALGETGDAYRCYLFSLFDEFALDLAVLFDRFSPQGRLFPREPALLGLLDLINDPEIESLWAEDETIGWIYQYFNSQEERRQMRADSSAPRNSRELAVRNQFFTPRYVVEFLTDNTLGRLWYEMTQGQTVLTDRCRYLIRYPNEIFLQSGEEAPTQEEAQEKPSREELLKQPVYIPFRALKDPRDSTMIDPACGSMHFGLYAFDLFEVIYDEAWEIARGGVEARKSSTSFASFIAFVVQYPDKATFLADVPRLIIEHNLHGIDIDPRAAQIAGLSLWLRAQRTWRQQGLRLQDRPRIRRSNIICAEPMPGEEPFLEEFIEAHLAPTPERKLLGQLVRHVFDAMKLAGETGSLLKVDEEIAGAVAEAKQKWLAGPASEQGRLFADDTAPPAPKERGLDVTGITDETFWEKAEDRIYAALQSYAEQAEHGGYQRRLFADDAARGFAFIDLCRKRYDVVLTNPPFGDASLPSKPYLDETYGDTKGDVYKAFVECFQARLVPAGYLGIISSRTGFFLSQSEDWRTRVVLRLFRPIVLADLGMGVLDAMVEVAAYVLRNLSEPETRDLTLSLVPVLEKVERDRQDRFSLPKWQAVRNGLKRHQAIGELEHLAEAGFIQRCLGDIVRYSPLWRAVKAVTAPSEPVYPPLVCIRALAEDDKGAVLAAAVRDAASKTFFVCNPGGFSAVPTSPFSYWVSQGFRNLFKQLEPIQGGGRYACVTNPLGENFRYVRTSWEVAPSLVGRDKRWVSFAKGGSYSPYYSDLHLLVDWDRSRGTYRGFIGTSHRPLARPASSNHFFRPGITWSSRADGLSFRLLPAGAVFSGKGPALFCDADNSEMLLTVCGVVSSSVFEALVAIQLGRVSLAQSYEVGLVQQTPFPKLTQKDSERLANYVRQVWAEKCSLDSVKSTAHPFVRSSLLAAEGTTLARRADAWVTRVRKSEETVAAIQAEIDELTFRLYGLYDVDRTALTASHATESTDDAEAEAHKEKDEEEDEATTTDSPALTADLLTYALGAALGYWDIRFATGEKPAPELPDPFAPLPACPPGQLQNEQGLPITKEDVTWLKEEGHWNYPIEIPWDGILVDDPGHPLDFETRVHQALQVIWKDCWEAIEREACEILGVRTLRDYFRKPTGFFAGHLKHYSRSRRKAPIYWPLQTPSGSYTLWLYYHRLDDQTLYTCVNDFVERAKLHEVTEELNTLLTKTDRSKEEEKKLDHLLDFEQELKDFRDELLRVAQFWKPNLNHGVQITAAPLWKLFQHKSWQKTLKETWDRLEHGDYDWAHLAYSIWPDRVREKCKHDKSLAIAHGLEDLYEEPPAQAKKKRGRTRG
jgi:hypothetical protein